MDDTWYEKLEFFKGEDYQTVIETLRKQKKEGASILPKNDLILNALKLTPYDEVKAVILGQDPYPNASHAMGLAFSVPQTVENLPPSLKNIFKELENDTGIVRTNGDLTDWAKQGVLLLNASLTLIEGKSNSHAKIGWVKLLMEVMRTLSDEKEHLVFLLWGRIAQTYARFIDPDKHKAIMTAHPSPLSASKGWFGSKPFSRTNEYLKQHNIEEIQWQ